MAKATEYVVGVKLEGDAVDLKESVDTATGALGDLAEAAQKAADDAGSSLQEVPGAAADMADGVADATSDAVGAIEELPDAAKAAADTTADAYATIPEAADSAAAGVAGATAEMTTAFEAVPTAAESMAADVDAATVSMVDSFETVPIAAAEMSANIDAQATSIVNTSGKKLKATGKLLGGQIVSGMTGELASGDSRAQLVGTANTLFNTLLIVGGPLALGAGIAGSVITGFIKAADAKKQQMADAFNAGFAALEVNAESTGREIAESIMKGFDFESAAASLGGEGGAQAGFQKLKELSDASGASIAAIVELINQGVNPSTQLTADLVERVAKNYRETTTATGNQIQGITELNRLGEDTLSLAEANAQKQADLLEMGKANRDYMASQADSAERLSGAAADYAQQTSSYADAMERANNAALQLAGRRLPTGNQLAGMP